MGAVFVAYRQVRHLTSGDTGKAVRNADRVVSIERHAGVFTERRGAAPRAAQRARSSAFLNRYYVGVHFPATIALLRVGVLAPPGGLPPDPRRVPRRHAGRAGHPRRRAAGPAADARAARASSTRCRSTDRGSTRPTRPARWPTSSPPCRRCTSGGRSSSPPAIIGLLRSRWRFLAIAHPAVTLLAIVATANHYWLDAAVALRARRRRRPADPLVGRPDGARRSTGPGDRARSGGRPPSRPRTRVGPGPGAGAPGTRAGHGRRSSRQDVSRCWRR